MAASVRVEDEAFADRRYHRLAKLAGLADDDHARGKMLVLWRQCTIENQEVLPLVDVLDVLGSDGLAALVGSNLGQDMGDGTVRISGTKGRIEWLQKLRENGKKGGRPPGKKNQKVSEKEPIGSVELNPPAPAPAPAPAPTKDMGGSNKAARKSALPKSWTPTEAHSTLADELFVDLDREAGKFRDHAEATGRTQKNWDAAFRLWLKKAGEWAADGAPTRPREVML